MVNIIALHEHLFITFKLLHYRLRKRTENLYLNAKLGGGGGGMAVVYIVVGVSVITLPIKCTCSSYCTSADMEFDFFFSICIVYILETGLASKNEELNYLQNNNHVQLKLSKWWMMQQVNGSKHLSKSTTEWFQTKSSCWSPDPIPTALDWAKELFPPDILRI